MEFDPKKYTDDDLKEMYAAIINEMNRRRTNCIMAARIDNNYSVGDRVNFCTRGKRYFGTITKLRSKTALIKVDSGGNWSVEYTFLKKTDKQSEEIHSNIKPGNLTLIPGYNR